MRERCDTALDTLRRVRTTFTNTRGSRQFTARTKQLGAEFNKVFLGKRRSKQRPCVPEKKNKTSYTHGFICLNECNQKIVQRKIQKIICFWKLV